MSEAVPEIAPEPFYRRPALRDLADMPMPTLEAVQARASLAANQLGVWFALRVHLWQYGELPAPTNPAAVKRLAGIGGVTPRTFRAMMPALAPLFDQDTFGRWYDHDLAIERNRRLDLSPESRVALEDLLPSEAAPRAIDPDRSAKMARNGSAGGRVTQERRRERERLQLVQGGRTDGNLRVSPMAPDLVAAIAGEDAHPAADGMQRGAKLEAKDQANDGADEAGADAGFASSGEAAASGADGKLASFEFEEIHKLASKQAARADAGQGEPTEATVQAKPSGAIQAERQANGSSDPAPAGPSDAAIVDAVVRVCAGKVDKVGAHRRIPIFRQAIADGLDFFHDILPELEGFARRNARVENCANKHVIEDARGRAASRKATAGSTAAGSAEQVWIDQDSPQWRAWCSHKRGSFPTTTSREHGHRRGWYFPSEWPPRMDSAASGQPPPD